MENRELFVNDPTTSNIPNSGVTKVVEPETDEQWETLRYELSKFVSEGEYGQGLERILSNYLTHLSREEQPAVWVSGFYGSGKSHLVRVLEYLWRDVRFPDGATARGLTPLPDEIQQELRELSIRGRQEGGLWSAAGTLAASAGNSVRLAMLAIIFRSAGLPSEYAAARLLIYLKRQGAYDALIERFQDENRDLDFELRNMYVSPVLARALAAVVPDFPDDVREIRELLKVQYPSREDISDDEMLDTIEEVLSLASDTPGRLPCTLLIFDELQQYIGEDPQRTLRVQNVVEACSSHFGSRMLFVATGQNALQATPQLSKLQGRFTVRVELSDADVQKVVREVVLRKRPDRILELRQVLDRATGEINRELAGTRIGPSQSDLPDLVPDYPLLPVRQRFWEGVLRAVDSQGGAGQLRTQLRIVHETTREVAARPVGTVIPGDAIYQQLETEMRQSGLLLREMQERIQGQNNGTPDGRLRARLCAAIFLISKLSEAGPAATGVEPTAEMLADLLVEDLTDGGAEVRGRVPQLLADLVRENVLIQVDDQYRLQTKESAEWQADFQQRYTRIRYDEPRIADARTAQLRRAVESTLRGLNFVQGVSKTPRDFTLDFGDTLPSAGTDRVPVWVRDEWSVPEGTVRGEAQQAGEESPIVFVFLPRLESDNLRDALAASAAAAETLNARPAPRTPEGVEARSAMESRRTLEENRVAGIIAGVIERARVYQGGGIQLYEGSLAPNVKTAVENAFARLFPQFALADNASWGRVVAQAGNGAVDALSAVGWSGDPEKNPVCQCIISYVGGSGKRGVEIRSHFTGAGFGWPRDAIDGSLLVLLNANQLRAMKNGQPQQARRIAQSQLGTLDFFAEDVIVPVATRIQLRSLLQSLGIRAESNAEAEGVRQALQMLTDLASQAGGPPPAPPPPSTALVQRLSLEAGNAQLLAIDASREQLIDDYQRWRETRDAVARRLPRWNLLEDLLARSSGADGAVAIATQAGAIREQRSLLADPDPVPPLLQRLSDLLRGELTAARQRMAEAREQALRSLQQLDAWQQLPADQQERILRDVGLGPAPELHIGTDAELLGSLGNASLADWDDRIQAIPTRADRARDEAIRLVSPQTVTVRPPSATITTPQGLDEYLAQLRQLILTHLEAGNPVVL